MSKSEDKRLNLQRGRFCAIYINRDEDGYQVEFTTYNGTVTEITPKQANILAWIIKHIKEFYGEG